MERVICPYCKSERTVKRGLSNTAKRGKQQRYICNECHKTFLHDKGFWKMKNKDAIVTMAIDMYLSNMSSRKMRNQLWRHFRIKVSHVTILDWVRKYVRKVRKYVDTAMPKLTGRVYADETMIDCEKRKDVFWCSIDWDSRFINATLYSEKSQNMDDAIEFMRRIKKTVKPEFVQTDGLPMYPRAFRKVFGSRYNTWGIEHRVNNVYRSKKHNVRIETVFSKIKDRVYDFRGFKASWSAPILMDGIVLQHNFIEEHTTTRKHPCALAGIDMDLGCDRWMGLIEKASMV